MAESFLIIVIATSIWVLIDAKTLGVKKGQIQRMGDMGPWSRPEYKKIMGARPAPEKEGLQ